MLNLVGTQDPTTWECGRVTPSHGGQREVEAERFYLLHFHLPVGLQGAQIRAKGAFVCLRRAGGVLDGARAVWHPYTGRSLPRPQQAPE